MQTSKPFLFSAYRRLALSVLLVALAWVVAPRAHAEEDPQRLVEQLSQSVLEVVLRDREELSSNPAKLVALVDELILPHLNFERTTQLAAGRHWRAATPEQREALTREFRVTLVRTYSGAVSAVRDGTRIELRPSRNDANATDVVVRTQILQPGGDPIPVDYRLEKTDSGWKIFDVNVLGIWLVENYRNQFNQQITQSGLDGLIRTLTERNQGFTS